jgi:hypothetical protein
VGAINPIFDFSLCAMLARFVERGHAVVPHGSSAGAGRARHTVPQISEDRQ